LAVAVFLAAYAVSFLDRQILSLIVEPLKHDLGISDTQIGIVQGPAFGLFYATLGLPLGWLADRVHRVRLIAVAISLWSMMTMICGFATDFTSLLIARFGVGIGEAALVPAAVSLLADLFRPARRALPVSVFTCGLSIGGGLALTLGGAFIAFSETGAAQLPLVGPWLAGRAAWQNVFLLAGLAGIPVAAMVLQVNEPRQGARSLPDPLRSIRVAWEHLRAGRRFFVPMLASMAGFFVLTTALSAWLPTLFVRQHGWSATHAGRTLGVAIMICGLLGNLASGVLSNALARRGRRDATLLTILGGACAMTPAAIVTALLPAPEPALLATMLLYFSMALTFGIATVAFVEVTPPQLRGQVVALYLLVGNLVGLALGPVSVGALLDSGIPALASVGHSLALVCTLAGLPALWLLWRARAAFGAAAAGVEQ
jgi:MFS family permease